MSQWKRKLKTNDVSAPIKVEHVSHIGHQDVQVSKENFTPAPPALCSGPDINQESKTILTSYYTKEFQESLREIIRDEIKQALEAERHNLRSELQRLNLQLPCLTTTTSVEAQKGEDEEIRHWELVDVVPNVRQALSKNIQESCNSKPLPVPVQGIGVSNPRRQGHCQDENTRVLKQASCDYKRSLSKPKTAKRMSKGDERECLAQALQASIIPLVDGLQFNSSNLPEQLISSGYITEEECKMIRDELSRKDQVRYLVSRTKGRDLSDIQNFLELIKIEVPLVVTKILEAFEDNKRNDVKCTTCALCQCSSNIDIKDVVDILWSIRAIPDGFYNEVIACVKPLGSQRQLWKTLIDICNGKQNREKKKCYDTLFDSVLARGNFKFIIRPLKSMLEKDGRLDCHCLPSVKTSPGEIGSYGAMSSCTPLTSLSEERQSLPSEFSQDNEYVDETGSGPDRTKLHQLQRQTQFNVSMEETIPNDG